MFEKRIFQRMIMKTESVSETEKDAKMIKENLSSEEKLIECEQQVGEYSNTLKRLQAEFENYKKRSAKENSEFQEIALKRFLTCILPIIDSFEQALKNTKNHEHFVKGMELIYAQCISLLQHEGVKAIETQNKSFDPYVHEVLLQESSDKEDGLILEEFQRGYLYKGVLLRTAKVKVAVKKQD